jgi:ATP-dependent protease ClpP protease subunit
MEFFYLLSRVASAASHAGATAATRLGGPLGAGTYRYVPAAALPQRWVYLSPASKARHLFERSTQMRDIQIIGTLGVDIDPFELARAVNDAPARTELHLLIHSAGGICDDAFAIYDALQTHRRHGGYVAAEIEKAHSMAGVIAQAADEIAIWPHGMLEFHMPEVASLTHGMRRWPMARFVPSEAEAHDEAKALAAYAKRMAQSFAARAGWRVGDVLRLMQTQAQYNAPDAVHASFVDYIIAGEPPRPTLTARQRWLGMRLPANAFA